MSDELVPQGLPYGERQRVVEARRAAGVSTDAPSAPPSFVDPLRAARPDFDVLATVEPPPRPAAASAVAPVPPVPMTARERFMEIAAVSNNEFMRRVAERLAER